MKERPILFSGPMVRAVLDGRKTQTRRVVWLPPSAHGFGYGVYSEDDGDWWEFVPADEDGDPADGESHERRCPYGKPGDRLWVQETFRVATEAGSDQVLVQYRSDTHVLPFRSGVLAEYTRSLGKWRSSIFMPRWASRITLEVTEVRVQRLQEISERDAKSEGVDMAEATDGFPCYALGFMDVWEEINAKRPGCSWNENPHVWVIEFRRLT